MIFTCAPFWTCVAQDHHSYAQQGDSSLYLSIYGGEIPNSEYSNSNQTIILFAHGGGFSAGSRLQALNTKFCESLMRSGFTTASVDYQLKQKNRGFHCQIPIAEKRIAIHSAAQDLLDAWSYLQTLGFENVILIGSSAGAEAALHATYHIQADGIQGVVSIAGAMEPKPQLVSSIPLLAIHGVCDELVPYGSGIHHFCPEDSPGALLLHGGGALAEYLPNTRLISYVDRGHELSSELLADSATLDAVELFIRDILSNSPISRFTEIPSQQKTPCTPSHPH